MTTTQPLIGRDYLRVSHDASGRLRSPQEQHDDNIRAAAELGVAVNGESYAEADAVSASRYGGKIRGEFGRLLADIRGGRFGADVLVLWESSRGSRQVGEWVDLLDAARTAGIKILVTTHERLYNPARPADRKALLTDAVDAEYESGKTSDRIGRASDAAAAAGEVWGPAPFGYRHVYDVDGHGHRTVRRVPDPAEAAIVAELYSRVRRGDTFLAIARDFGERGIRGRGNRKHPGGEPLSGPTLRNMVMRAAYGSLRTHHGKETPADWPALVDAETFHAVRSALTSRRRGGTRAAHLLGMIATCGRCGSPMTSVHRGAEPSSECQAPDHWTYKCRDRGCTRIAEPELDEYATSVMLAYLAEPELAAELADRSDDTELATVRADLETARAELAQLRAAAAAGKVTVGTLLAVEPGIASRVELAEKRERELMTPSALSGLIDPGEDVAARWDAARMPARRRIARILLSPTVLGTLRVLPVGRRGVPAAERVDFDRGV